MEPGTPDLKEWPAGTILLLTKRANRSATSDDYVSWATQAIVDGFDSESLSILAGLDLARPVSLSEAEDYFDRTVRELGFRFPDAESVRRLYVQEMAERIVSGEVDPEEAVRLIHLRAVTPLDHPEDLRPWCFVWEGIDPRGTGPLEDQDVADVIRRLAAEWTARS